MVEITRNIQKQEVYKQWNFTVSAYDFEIPNGKRAGTILSLAELKIIRKKWSDELGSYYNQSQYITISKEQLQLFLKNTEI
jgi:hypothetical protein